MRRMRARSGFAFLALLLTAWGCSANDRAAPAGESGQAEATLPAWADREAKAAILSFVDRVTDASGPDFVPASERIAVFDNDGTLWAEKPLYFQLFLALDRVPVVAAERPELMESALIRAIVEGDQARIAAMDHHDIFEVATATHSGITVAEFQQAVRDWLQSARHPRFDRRYDELLYQPMLELLDYLRTNDFRVFIVSGGGIDFIRVFAETAYGIPPEQVVGSSTSGEFELREDGGVIVKGPDIASVNDRAVKPVNINLHIGRKPILAFGQLGWRPPDAPVHGLRGRAPSGADPTTRRPGPRVAVRSGVECRPSRRGAGRRGGARLDRGFDEG